MGLFDGYKQWGLVKKGNKFYEQERYEEALKCCDKALKMDPENSGIWHNKGLIIMGLIGI